MEVEDFSVTNCLCSILMLYSHMCYMPKDMVAVFQGIFICVTCQKTWFQYSKVFPFCNVKKLWSILGKTVPIIYYHYGCILTSFNVCCLEIYDSLALPI